VTLQDLLDDLLWPHLLRSWKLALAPGRIGLSFLFVCFFIAVSLAANVGGGDPVGAILRRTVGGAAVATLPEGNDGAVKAAHGLYDLFLLGPVNNLREHPAAMLIAMPLILLAWCAAGGAICRSCACEVSLRAALPWRQAVRFGLRKTPANAAAVGGPVALVWGACVLLWIAGRALFTWKVGGLLGAALFIFPLALCLVLGVAVTAYLLAHSLLIPAVACEGTDSFDAVQRCYAYVLSRPGRLVGYVLVAFFAALPVIFAVSAIGHFAVYTAVTVTGAPRDPGFFRGLLDEPGGEHWKVARVLVSLWVTLLIAVLVSYIISLYFCTATNLYLVMRRLVDGQDIHELWTPPRPAPSAPGTPAPAAVAATPPEGADYT